MEGHAQTRLLGGRVFRGISFQDRALRQEHGGPGSRVPKRLLSPKSSLDPAAIFPKAVPKVFFWIRQQCYLTYLVDLPFLKTLV